MLNLGGIFAIIAAFGFAFDSILIRRGLIEDKSGNIWEIRLISLIATLGIFILGVIIAAKLDYNIFGEFKYLSLTAILLLIISGILGALIGALLLASSIAQIGASHASALWGGSNPLFATLLAIIFLGETPKVIGLFSVATIVTGIIVVGYHGHVGTVALLKKTRLAGGIIALLSGLCFALSFIFTKAALNLGATQNTAFFIFQFTALIIVTIVCYIKSKNLKYLINMNRNSIYYFGAGIGVLVGFYGQLVAFTIIPVWQAIAIRSIQPLIVLLLSWLFLKRADKINLRLILGAVMVTIGVVILYLY